MAYSGNWLRSVQRVNSTATPLPAPSVRHGQVEGDPYPSDHQAPPGADYGDAEFGRPVVQTPGMPLDTPADSHDSPGGYGAYRSQAERQAVQSAGHDGRDRGWVRAAYVGRQPAQDDTTRYMESTWEGAGPTEISPVAIQRGINSLPQNNDVGIEGYGGTGWRRGLRNLRFVDRKNRIDPRVYTPQQLLARQITVPHNQPAASGGWGRRTSPFATMARPMGTVATRPGLFRSPPGLTDTILADQAAAADDGGIATDGMWAT